MPQLPSAGGPDPAKLLAAEFPESVEAWSVAAQLTARDHAVAPEDLPPFLEYLSRERADTRSNLWPTRLIVGVSGPGAVGKDTVLARAHAESPALRPLVLHTTRQPRAGEQDGVEYHFVTEARFDAMRSAAALIYHRLIQGRGRYGLHRAEVTGTKAGIISIVREAPQVILDISRTLSESGEGCHTLIFYLLPPAPMFETLCARLIGRDGGLGEAGVTNFATTLRPYNAVHFLSAMQHFRAGEDIIFLVNDDVNRVAELIVGYALRLQGRVRGRTGSDIR